MTGGRRPEEVLSPENAEVWQKALDAQSSVQSVLTYSVARPHAEDITQQTLIKLWEVLTREDPRQPSQGDSVAEVPSMRIDNVRGWMHTVSRRLMIDHKRALQTRTERLVEDHDKVAELRDRSVAPETLDVPETTPESMRALHGKAREMAHQLDGLASAWEVEIVVLHKAYRLPAEEVAEMLGTTESAVRSATYAGMKKLRSRKGQVLYRFGRSDSETSVPAARSGRQDPAVKEMTEESVLVDAVDSEEVALTAIEHNRPSGRGNG
ncbi:RNA polymerase sigma factor [Streptomyces graminifolii]|uniref:RNA polymerase sigma factor n=1 Tax=Streptomyces graminifolii TaxID=1266771 RepID=UPI0040580765